MGAEWFWYGISFTSSSTEHWEMTAVDLQSTMVQDISWQYIPVLVTALST